MECFKAHHWFGDPFDKAVVLLKDIVQVFDLPDFNHVACACEFQDGVDGVQSGQIGSTFVNDNLLRSTVGCDRLLEETPRCSQIPTFRQKKIKGLAIAVNGPIQIGPFAPNLDIRQELAVSRLRI